MAITGVFPMLQADAQGYIDDMGAGGMAYDVHGDDSNRDDHLDQRISVGSPPTTPRSPHCTRRPRGCATTAAGS